jgi:hypothetical protein
MAKVSPGLGGPSSLDRELLRMMQREQQQRRPAPRAYAPERAKEVATMSTHNMTLPQFIEWATPKVATLAGRAEVKRALVERVGWARGTADEKAAQQAIKLLGAENFNDATLKELTELSTEVSEATEEQAVATTKDADNRVYQGNERDRRNTRGPRSPATCGYRAEFNAAASRHGEALQRPRNEKQ